MSPVNHPVTGPALSFSLAEELQRLHLELDAVNERSARTLVKDGPLRVTLVAVKPGGTMHPHHADGPITIQVLEGEIVLHSESRDWPLPSGSLFALDAGITHSVRSTSGGAFLLTVVEPSADEAGSGETAHRAG